MAHGLLKSDHMFSVHKTPWHGLGEVLKTRPKTIAQALKLAKLDWTVSLESVYVQDLDSTKMIEVEEFKAVTRGSDQAVLGIVQNRYEIIQNHEAFAFLEAIMGEMIFETAGSLWGGKRVWALVRIPEFIEVGGDAVNQFGLVTTSHDGSAAAMYAITPVRVVCQNTLTWGLQRAHRTHKIRHTSNASQHIAEARQALDLTVNYYKQFKTLGDRLASQKFTERKLKAVAEKLWPQEGELSKLQGKRKEEREAALIGLFREGTIQGKRSSVGNAPGSAWCAVNAICEYVDHYADTRKPDAKFAKVMGMTENPKSRALQLVLAASNN